MARFFGDLIPKQVKNIKKNNILLLLLLFKKIYKIKRN
jgi:hypothetical protein